jgi:hypothetical protein
MLLEKPALPKLPCQIHQLNEEVQKDGRTKGGSIEEKGLRANCESP